MTITEFLQARISADEAAAKVDAGEMRMSSVSIQFDCETQQRFTPARVLAECAAKRAIIAALPASWTMLRALAAVYSDHPDYDPEWEVK